MNCRLDADAGMSANWAINHLAMRALEAVFADAVAASVRNGCAVLTGWVPSGGVKAAAEQAVRKVPGVIGVVNRIEVA
jgi:osmotically-inducible protein OsmY